MSSEEGIGPALVIGRASPDAGALLLLAQDRAEASAHEAVEDAVQAWRGMLEVAKPSPKYRVEVVNDPPEAVASATESFAALTLSFSAFRLFLRTSRRPASNR